MSEVIDYRVFDDPQIKGMMFYPQRIWTPPPPNATDYLVPTEDGVTLSARFYPESRTAPNILFFHGNGEIACQYDDIAPHYHEAGAGLFVVDFRGYGRSGGSPGFSAMVADARASFLFFKQRLADDGFTGPSFVKGRSLGGHSALEVAYHFQTDLRGMLMESTGSSLRRLAERLGTAQDPGAVEDLVSRHEAKVASIVLPLQVIHGERDELIPVEAAVDLYDSVGSAEKDIEIIPGAGHNDLLWLGLAPYFGAVSRFIQRHAG